MSHESEHLAPVHLIPAGLPGRLTASGGDQVPVRVFERGSDVLMLVVLLDADTGLEPPPLEPVLLEYTSAQGLVRLQGRAIIEKPDLIRFAPAQAPEVLQRREFVRVDAPQPVRLTDEVGATIATHAVDVSGGGMLLCGLEEFSEGQRLRFTLELGPGQEPVQGTARVVRTVGDGGRRGVVFEAISSTERQRLVHFIFDRQRAARAKTRNGARRKRRSA
jgi:hypothetical protein